jgi:hypothetical protein
MSVKPPSRPPWNSPDPMKPYLRWNDKAVEKALADSAAALKIAEAGLRAGSAAANGLKNVGVGTSRPGSVYGINAAGAPAWIPNVAGANPEYAIHMEEGNPAYYVYGAGFSTLLQEEGAVPPLTFVDDGMDFYTPFWDVDTEDGSFAGFQVAADYRVHVNPHADGDRFIVAGAVDTGFVNNQPTIRNVSFFNESYDYTAEIQLRRSTGITLANIMYDGGSTRLASLRTLQPRERISWSAYTPVDSTEVWMVRPAFDTPNNGQWGNEDPWFPLDFWYWRNIHSRRLSQSFFATGDIAVTTGGHGLSNDTDQWRRIGLVSANLGTGSVGSPVSIDVKIDGVSVFASPLTIPTGSTAAVTKEPDAYTHPNAGGFYDDGSSAVQYAGLDSVLWLPGQKVTVDIVGVGSSFPGANLTVQVYYG